MTGGQKPPERATAANSQRHLASIPKDQANNLSPIRQQRDPKRGDCCRALRNIAAGILLGARRFRRFDAVLPILFDRQSGSTDCLGDPDWDRPDVASPKDWLAVLVPVPAAPAPVPQVPGPVRALARRAERLLALVPVLAQVQALAQAWVPGLASALVPV